MVFNQMRDYPKNGKVWIVYTQQGGKQQILVMWATLIPTADFDYLEHSFPLSLDESQNSSQHRVQESHY